MIIRAIITTIVMIALTLVSFGHRSLSPADEAQAQSYILAGGNWADLCGDGDDPLASSGKCMACVLSHSCALPPPSDDTRAPEIGITLKWAMRSETTAFTPRTWSHSARAPPFV